MTNSTPKTAVIRRILRGVVVSAKMQKTVVVQVDRLKLHPLYQKSYKVSHRYKAHDPKGMFHVGDAVAIRQVRPISKDKRWLVMYPSAAGASTPTV